MSAIRGVAPDQPPVAATNGRLAAANSVPSGAPVSLRLNLAASAAAATAGTPRTAPAYNRQRDLHPAPRGLQERGYAPACGGSEAHTSDLQSLMRISYAALGLNIKQYNN